MTGLLEQSISALGAQDHLLIIEVPPGRLVHATAKDDAFLRIGDENHRLTLMQRRERFYDKTSRPSRPN